MCIVRFTILHLKRQRKFPLLLLVVVVVVVAGLEVNFLVQLQSFARKIFFH